MKSDLKQYIYSQGKDAALDAAFNSAAIYGKVKLAQNHIFWKEGLRWCAVPLNRVQRIFRRVEYVNGRLCCGSLNYDIQRLVLVLDDNSTLDLLIGENQAGNQVAKEAESLFQALKETHPELKYGKES